ncbi:glutamate-1-semialdehyde aminotransferase, partial [Nannochloropsis oceanica]
MMKHVTITALLLPTLATAFLAPIPAKQQVRMMAATMAPFKTDKSSAVFEEAKGIMPGGVSSPVRAFKSVGGNPIVFDKVR